MRIPPFRGGILSLCQHPERLLSGLASVIADSQHGEDPTPQPVTPQGWGISVSRSEESYVSVVSGTGSRSFHSPGCGVQDRLST